MTAISQVTQRLLISSRWSSQDVWSILWSRLMTFMTVNKRSRTGEESRLSYFIQGAKVGNCWCDNQMKISPWLDMGSLDSNRAENLLNDRIGPIWPCLNARQLWDSASTNRRANWYASDMCRFWTTFRRWWRNKLANRSLWVLHPQLTCQKSWIEVYLSYRNSDFPDSWNEREKIRTYD